MEGDLEIVVAIVAAVILAVLTGGVALFRANVKRDKFKAWIETHSPEDLKEVAVWAALKAYDAVEQVASAYESMSSEEKQALAAKYAQALISLVLYGKASTLASTALLESQIRADKHPDLARAPRTLSVPEPVQEINIGGTTPRA